MKTLSNFEPTSKVTDVATIPGLNELWNITRGDPQVCIAVLDGPVDRSHPSLASSNLSEIDTLSSSVRGGGPALQHGTHVASIIFGRHDSHVNGIAPDCRGLIAPIYTDVFEAAPVPCSQLDLARSILQAVEAGAHLINISGGQLSDSGLAHPVLADAVRQCAASGVLIVAAAGNQGCQCLHIPGALPSVLTVGAMNSDGEPLDFSNWGAAYAVQGILAPGNEILGANPGGGTRTGSGTSFAAPIVTGIAALLLSVQIKLGQKPDVSVIRQALLNTALGCEHEPITDCRRLLAGRLNVCGALATLTSGVRTLTKQLNVTPQYFSAAESENTGPSGQVMPACIPSPVEKASPITGQSAQGSPAANQAIQTEQSTVSVGQVTPSACGCGGKNAPPQRVYALGQLGYDFGSEARRDAFIQSMSGSSSPNPDDALHLLDHLDRNPWDAASLIWTLSLDSTVAYAIMPAGPFAADAYQLIRKFLMEFYTEGIERVSIPGTISGAVQLFNGQNVPVIIPEIRGMFSWTTPALVQSLVGTAPEASSSEKVKAAHSKKAVGMRNFLDRIYFELRNLGITSQDRAMNYAGTNALNIENVYESAFKEDMDLDVIEVERSPMCRPGSDCWDVKLIFFFPDRQVQTVRKAYRFTVDVSDVVPVTVGPVRSWFIR